MGSLVTVVVPIYNVGGYLVECLNSLAGQTYTDLEVVQVDDGSTDGSGEIAAGYAGSDCRFRLIRQPNRGLGAARNTGIDAGTGEYLAFVDGDDVLPPYAVEVLVGALEQSGSDFASGNVALFNSRGLWPSPLHRGTHRVTRLRIRLNAQRNLVYDRLACNKIFRRSFWDRHGLRFPEGVRYEDIPVTIPAYALAEAVDLVDLPVYHWRQREAGSELSISQRVGEIRNVVDRFAAVNSASRSLAGLVKPEVKNRYDEVALRSDLRMFLDLLPDVDDDYRQRFLDLAVDFLDRVDSSVLDRLPPRLRIAWRLARARALPELIEVVAASRNGATPPLVRRGFGRYLRLPLLDAGHPAVPRELYRLSAGIHTEVHEIRWSGDRLLVRGLAFDAERGAAHRWGPPRMLWLREAAAAQRILPLPAWARRTAHPPSSVPYGWSGFSVSVDARRMRGPAGWLAGKWVFNVAILSTIGAPQRRILVVGDVRPALPARWVDDGVRIVPYLFRGQLLLRVERPRAWACAARVDGAELLVEGVAIRRPTSATLRLGRAAGVLWRCYPIEFDPPATTGDPAATVGTAATGGPAGVPAADDPVRWMARIPWADLVVGAALGARPVFVGEAGVGWRVAYDDGDAGPVELPVAADFAGPRHAVDGVELTVVPTDEDLLGLRVLPAGPVVSGVDLVGDVLVLTGRLPDAGVGWQDLRLSLRARQGTAPDAGAERVPPPDLELRVGTDGAVWTVRIPLTGPAGPPDGDWSPLYRKRAADASVDLPFDVSAQRRLPRQVIVGDRRLESLRDRHREILRFGPRIAAG